VSSAPGPELPLRAAVFEAECQPGAASVVADEFASIPQVFSANITTRPENLYAFVIAADQPLLAALVVDRLPAIAGLNRVQSALMTQWFSGTRWRLGVTVLDTRVVLRSVKSWGRLLGLDGRAQDVVPVDLWAPV